MRIMPSTRFECWVPGLPDTTHRPRRRSGPRAR